MTYTVSSGTLNPTIPYHKVTKHDTIPYVTYAFPITVLLTFSVRCTVFLKIEIRLQKCHDLENRVKGP